MGRTSFDPANGGSGLGVGFYLHASTPIPHLELNHPSLQPSAVHLNQDEGLRLPYCCAPLYRCFGALVMDIKH